MNIRDVYSAKAIALVQKESASNKVAYLGAGLFPARKKMGLDLKWIKTSKGLAVSGEAHPTNKKESRTGKREWLRFCIDAPFQQES